MRLQRPSVRTERFRVDHDPQRIIGRHACRYRIRRPNERGHIGCSRFRNRIFDGCKERIRRARRRQQSERRVEGLDVRFPHEYDRRLRTRRQRLVRRYDNDIRLDGERGNSGRSPK